MKRKTERLLVPYFLGSIVLLGIYKVLGRTTKEMLFSGIGVLYSRYCFYNMDIAAEKNNIFSGYCKWSNVVSDIFIYGRRRLLCRD